MFKRALAVLRATCLAGLALGPHLAAQDVAVVVNPRNPVSKISLVDLSKILAGDKRNWPGGMPIKLIVRPAGAHERLVMLRLLNMSESDYQQHWTAQVFRGEADAPPATVPSVGIQREAVLVFPGSLTLIDASAVKAGMKVLKVEGLLPAAVGYSLH